MMELPSSLQSRIIERGAIFHSEMFYEIDHGKFFAVIGISGDTVAGFFFINSRIHPSLRSKPEQFAMQYPLRHSDYGFLRYDSFLCATAVITISVDRLNASISSGVTSLVGNLTACDLSAVLEACRLSPLFTPSEKRRFFY